MKDLMNRAIDFLTFDAHLPAQQISLQFSEIHHKRQSEINEWSTIATRQQLASSYWSSHVTGHFAVFFGGSAGISFLVTGGFYQPDLFLVNMFIVCPVVYLGFYIFQYRPNLIQSTYPVLKLLKMRMKKKQIEQLEKCQQAQLSNFSLALFFYVFIKTNNLNAISCDDHSANLLKKLYGVDSGCSKLILKISPVI